jgi:hypothetical protein
LSSSLRTSRSSVTVTSTSKDPAAGGVPDQRPVAASILSQSAPCQGEGQLLDVPEGAAEAARSSGDLKLSQRPVGLDAY